MIKLTFALTRRAEFTREAFQTYWLGTHAPLVASARKVLRIRRYIQAHSLPAGAHEMLQASRGGPREYDGVAELWWDSLEDVVIATSDPAGIEAGRMLLEDERRFIDLSRSPLWWSEEQVIFG